MTPIRQPSQTEATRDKSGLITHNSVFYCATESDARSFHDPLAGTMGLVNRKWRNADEGLSGFMLYLSYQGIEGESTEGTVEWDSSFAEEPIESHPNLLKLMETYKGTFDEAQKPKRVAWAETVTGLPGMGKKEVKNPMLGVQTYRVLGVVFRKTYCSKSLPDHILEGIGRIVDNLPGGYPTPPERNWLSLPPKISQKGNVYQLVEELLLSPLKNKWLPEVHDLLLQ